MRITCWAASLLFWWRCFSVLRARVPIRGPKRTPRGWSFLGTERLDAEMMMMMMMMMMMIGDDDDDDDGDDDGGDDDDDVVDLVGGFNHLEKYESQWEGL